MSARSRRSTRRRCSRSTTRCTGCCSRRVPPTRPIASDDSLDWQDLPTLRADDSDPQMPWLRTLSIDDPVQRLAALESAPSKSPEVLLARARAALDAGQFGRVDDAG